MDQKDHEDEYRGAQARAQGALDVALAGLERAANPYQEQGAGRQAGADRTRRPFVEAGQDQPRHRGDGHRARCDPEKQRLQRRRARPEQEDGNRAEARREGGPGCGEQEDQHQGET